MDTVLDNDSGTKAKTVGGFFKAVFDSSTESQVMLLNAGQFATLALLPSYGLLRLLREYVPPPMGTKGSLEIVVEVIAQTVSMVIGIVVIDRAVSYVPTLSGVPYASAVNIVPGILIPFIIILLTVQTKLGAKIDILYARAAGEDTIEALTAPEPEAQHQISLLPRHTSTQMPQLGGHSDQERQQSAPATVPVPPVQQEGGFEPEPFSFGK